MGSLDRTDFSLFCDMKLVAADLKNNSYKWKTCFLYYFFSNHFLTPLQFTFFFFV